MNAGEATAANTSSAPSLIQRRVAAIPTRLFAGIRRIVHAMIYHISIKRAISRFDVTSLFGLTLCIPPTVFHPRFFRTSRIFAQFLGTQNFQGELVLEMGCGSGLLSLIAARQGAKVTALDVNSAAVAAAGFNSTLNGLENSIRCLESDLFSALHERDTFDCIIWSPPFYPKDPVSMAERAWYSGSGYSVIREFAHTARNHMRPHGRMLLLRSTEVDEDMIRSMFSEEGFSSAAAYCQHRPFETVTVYELRWVGSTS